MIIKKFWGISYSTTDFPQLDYDSDIRQAYRGGFTYLKKGFSGKEIGQGIVLDVNSLYPYVLHDMPMPYGEPIYFDGKYKEDEQYNLYIQMFRVDFKLKEGYLPTLQLKHNLAFVPTEYVEESGDESVTLCLASPDIELFFKHYDTDYENIEWIGGWKFKSSTNLFTEYVDKWAAIKIESTISGNLGMRTLAKLMQNALYGKFGLNPKVRSKIPKFVDGRVKYEFGEYERRDPIYIPVAVFTTAWARYVTINAAQANYDRFVYADTDSLHLIGLEEPKGLDIHPTKLGAWKHESTFHRAKFIRAKSYVEEEYNNTFYLPESNLYGTTQLKVTCAGMPKSVHKNVRFENFEIGSSFKGKLRNKRVKGGIVLVDTPFTIKE